MRSKVYGFVIGYIIWCFVAMFLSFSAFMPAEALFKKGSVPLSPLAILLYIVLLMVPLFLFVRWVSTPPRWTKKVLDEGRSATATILNYTMTGIRINRSRMYSVKLRIYPEDESPFEVSLDKLFPIASPLLSTGSRFQAKYDADDKSHVVLLELLSGKQNPGSDTPADAFTRNLAELSRMHKNGELTDEEFNAAKKKLLQ